MMLAERLAALPWWLLLLASGACGLGLLAISASLSPIWGIAVVIGLGVFLLMVRRPYIGLWLTAAVIPIERLGRLTDDSSQWTFSLMRLIGMTACAALLIHNLGSRKGFHLGTPFILYAIYTLLAILSVAYSTDFTGSVRASGSILANLIFLFLVVNLIDKEERAFQAIAIWLFASAAVAAYSIYDWHLGSGASNLNLAGDFDAGAGVQSMAARFSTVWQDRAEWETLGGLALRRSMGTTSHAAVYGINLIMTVPFLLLFLKLSIPRLAKAASLLALGMILYNTLLTNTRAVVLLVGVVTLVAAARRLIQVRWQHIVLGLFIGAAVLPLLPEDIYNRIFDLTNYSVRKSSSIRARQDYAVAGFKAISDNFLLGVGVGNQNEIPKYLSKQTIGPTVTSVHNEYIQTFLEVGVGGWLIFITFIGQLLAFAFKAASNFKRLPGKEHLYWLMVACQICMLSVLVFGIQVDVFHFPLKGWWLVAGITNVMYLYSRRLLAEQASGTPIIPDGRPLAPRFSRRFHS